jgi:hypothetical protein
MTHETGRIGKTAIAQYFKIIPQNLSAENEEQRHSELPTTKTQRLFVWI